jgi:hypothetical protein
MDGTGQESYPAAAFVVRSVETLGSIKREVVNRLLLGNEISKLRGNINIIKQKQYEKCVCVCVM